MPSESPARDPDQDVWDYLDGPRVTIRLRREQLGNYIITDEIYIWEGNKMQNTPSTYGWNYEFKPGDKVTFMGKKGKVSTGGVALPWQVPVVFKGSDWLHFINSVELKHR